MNELKDKCCGALRQRLDSRSECHFNIFDQLRIKMKQSFFLLFPLLQQSNGKQNHELCWYFVWVYTFCTNSLHFFSTLNTKFTLLILISLHLLTRNFLLSVVKQQQHSLRWSKAGKRGMKPIQDMPVKKIIRAPMINLMWAIPLKGV